MPAVIYKGDIYYKTLKDHLNASGLMKKWTQYAEEAGFEKYREREESDLRRLSQYDRLFSAITASHIERLKDLDAILAEEDKGRTFLADLFLAAKSRGVRLVAVPEDVITFLVLMQKRPAISAKYLREVVRFKPEITEALVTLLGVGP